jgi:hypothetical protein
MENEKCNFCGVVAEQVCERLPPDVCPLINEHRPLTLFTCFPKCDHVWDGEPWEGDGVWTATCSRCGARAIDESMREG